MKFTAPKDEENIKAGGLKAFKKSLFEDFFLVNSASGMVLWFILLYMDKTFISHFWNNEDSFVFSLSGFGSFISLLLYASLLYLFLDVYFNPQVIFRISSLVSMLLWVIVGIGFIILYPLIPISSLTMYPLEIAYFIESFSILFMLLGISCLFMLFSSLRIYFIRKIAGIPSYSLFLFYFGLALLLVGNFYKYIFSSGFFVVIGVVSASFSYLYTWEWESTSSKTPTISSQDNALLRGGEYIGDNLLVPGRAGLIEFFYFLVFLSFLYFSAFIVFTPFRFTTLPNALLYFSYGFLLFSSLSFVLRFTFRKRLPLQLTKASSWILQLLVIGLFFMIGIFLPYSSHLFTDTTYHTEAPPLNTVIWASVCFSWTISLYVSYYSREFRGQFFKLSRKDSKILVIPFSNTKNREVSESFIKNIFIKSLWGKVRRVLAVILIVLAIEGGIESGLGQKTFSTNLEESLDVGLKVTLFILVIIIPLWVFKTNVVDPFYKKRATTTFSTKNLHMKLSPLKLPNWKLFFAFKESSVKKSLRKVTVVAVVLISILAMVFHDPLINSSVGKGVYHPSNSDNNLYYSPDLEIPSYPRVLGIAGNCWVIEESPLTKVTESSIYTPLLMKHLFSDNDFSSPFIIKKFMARNEFEVIQVVIVNRHSTPLTIDRIIVMNSTYQGLPSAFSYSPYIKTWKNQSWEWERVSVSFVKDLREGFPDVLYPIDLQTLNGTLSEQGFIDPYGYEHSLRDKLGYEPFLLYDFQSTIGGMQYTYTNNYSAPLPTIEPFSSLSLWITLYTGKDISPGHYSDSLCVVTNQEIINFTILTKIWNFSIPDSPLFRTAIGNRAVYYLDNRDEWNKNFLKHRMSPYFPYNIRTLYTRNGTQITFNFTEFEEDIENAIRNGLTSFRINFSPGGINEDAFTEEFNETALSFYSQFGAFLENHTLDDGTGRTWLDLALIYAMDEPTEEDYPLFNKWSELVHRAHPGLKVLLTEEVQEEINGSVDIWCPFINNLDPLTISPQKEDHREFWYYTCCSVSNQPTVLYIDPGLNHLALFWTAWAFDLDGYLNWDAAAYIGRDCNDPYYLGYNELGDATMLFSDAALNPINTIVWELMREGEEDAEYLLLLESLNPSSSLLEEIQKDWSSFTQYPQSFMDYHAARYLLGEEISSLLSWIQTP